MTTEWTNAWNDELEMEYLMGDMNGIAFAGQGKADKPKPKIKGSQHIRREEKQQVKQTIKTVYIPKK